MYYVQYLKLNIHGDYMNDSFKSLIITFLILIIFLFLFFIKICIDLKIYSSCYNDSSNEFYNKHKNICEMYRDY